MGRNVAGGVQARYTRALPAPDERRGRALQPGLLDEWAYVRPYRSEAGRRRRLDSWLQTYNHHRATPLSEANPPISRANNLRDHYP